MSNLPREPGVGERYDCEQHQPSASNMLMLQAISPDGPSVLAKPEEEFVSSLTGLFLGLKLASLLQDESLYVLNTVKHY